MDEQNPLLQIPHDDLNAVLYLYEKQDACANDVVNFTREFKQRFSVLQLNNNDKLKIKYDIISDIISEESNAFNVLKLDAAKNFFKVIIIFFEILWLSLSLLITVLTIILMQTLKETANKIKVDEHHEVKNKVVNENKVIFLRSICFTFIDNIG